LQEATNAYERDDRTSVFLKYAMASEQGLEMAQNNLAYLLDEGRQSNSRLSSFSVSFHMRILGYFKNLFSDREARIRALQQWNRAAQQSNAEAKIKVGDHYYYGWGTEIDYMKAGEAYMKAESDESAQAMFNLGYMYEHGLGFQQVSEHLGLKKNHGKELVLHLFLSSALIEP
jgi:SEL1 protein